MHPTAQATTVRQTDHPIQCEQLSQGSDTPSLSIHGLPLEVLTATNASTEARSKHVTTCGRTEQAPGRTRERWTPQGHERRLAALGYTTADYDCFRNWFVGSRFNFAQRDRRADGSEEWRTRAHGLSDALLLEHLEYRHWIGTRCLWDKTIRRFRPRFFAIDLDLKGDRTDQCRRYDLTCGVLGAPTFVFKSSASGGLHAYFHLAAEIDLWDLRHRDGGRGAVVELLAAHGLPEENGVMEVYPRGRYKVAGTDPEERRTLAQTALRLPFGEGSRLLDGSTLEPRHGDPRCDLPWVREHFEAGAVAFIDGASLVERARELGPPPPAQSRPARARPTHVRASRHSPADAVYADAHELWTTGLSRQGQRHTATMTLAIDLARKGFEEREIAARIHAWLDANHNDVSKTYRRNPAAAHKDIDGIVRRVVARRKRRTGPKWGSPRPLSVYEVEQIMRDLDDDNALVDPATGEQLDRYDVERFLFELLARAKEWVVVRLSSVDLDDGKRVRSVWPDQSESAFVIQSPVVMRRRLRGFGKDRHLALWRAIVNGRAMKKVQGSSARAKRAARYLVRLDFGAESATAITFSTLAGALTTLLSPAELDARYGVEVAARVRRHALAAAPVPTDSAGLPEERIRVRLRDAFERTRRKSA